MNFLGDLSLLTVPKRYYHLTHKELTMNLNELIEKLQTLQAEGKGNAEVNYFNAHILETVKRVKVVEPYACGPTIILDTDV